MPEIQMPKLSDTMTEGTLVRGRKRKATTSRPARSCRDRDRQGNDGMGIAGGRNAHRNLRRRRRQGKRGRQDCVHRWRRGRSAEGRRKREAEKEEEPKAEEEKKEEKAEPKKEQAAKKEPEQKEEKPKQPQEEEEKKAGAPHKSAEES